MPLQIYRISAMVAVPLADVKKKQSNERANGKNDQKTTHQATSSPSDSLSKSPTCDSDDDLVCLDSDVEVSFVDEDDDSMILDNSVIYSSKKNATQSKQTKIKSTNVKSFAASRATTSSVTNDCSDDEIQFCSQYISPAKPSKFDTSFDQFDPSLLPADFKFVKKTRIKFKFKGSFHCVEFKSTDKFKDKLDEISETLKIDTSSMILMFDNKTISFEESPESLNIGICDIIDVFEKKKDENWVEEREDPNLFKIKFRDCESRKRVQDVMLSMNRYDTFEQIFRKYAQLKETPLERIIFEFDGERMAADEKPDDLDMETESLVDVKIKTA